MAKVQILVGSVNGTALQTATVLAHVLNRQGHVARLEEEPSRHTLSDDPEESLLICCSTTGDGEVPRNITPLYLALEDEQLDLAGRQYGVVALGDSGYQKFAQAGYLLEEAMYRCGGRRMGEICTLDAKTTANPPLVAAQWVNAWVTTLTPPQV